MSETIPEYRAGKSAAEVRRATTNLRGARTEANQLARDSIRVAEKVLVDALDGERLHGAPNLGSSGDPIYGYRIRAKRAEERLSFKKKESLVLSDLGELSMAFRTREGSGLRTAEDSELRAEDLGRVLEVIEVAARRHLAKAARRTKRFQNVSNLADKVAFILGEDA